MGRTAGRPPARSLAVPPWHPPRRAPLPPPRPRTAPLRPSTALPPPGFGGGWGGEGRQERVRGEWMWILVCASGPTPPPPAQLPARPSTRSPAHSAPTQPLPPPYPPRSPLSRLRVRQEGQLLHAPRRGGVERQGGVVPAKRPGHRPGLAQRPGQRQPPQQLPGEGVDEEQGERGAGGDEELAVAAAGEAPARRPRACAGVWLCPCGPSQAGPGRC
jgi:hypothetical protein